MIITHTANAEGSRRVYLGGRSSLECWIEPSASGWRLQVQPSYCGNPLPEVEREAWARQLLSMLAETLQVTLLELPRVTFEQIAACHTPDPYAGHRGPAIRKLRDKHSFLAVMPARRSA